MTIDIKALMEALGWDVRDLADAVGCSTSTVYAWLNGTQPTSREYVRRLRKLEKKAGKA